MAWIKIEHTLPTKPEVFQLAKNLLTTRQEIIGHLVTFWIWVDQNSEDGTMEATEEMIDMLTMPNFAFELMKQGWISLENRQKGEKVEQDILTIKDFEKHNSNSAKKRALGAQRIANMRMRNAKSVTREDKKREDKKKERKETWTK